MLSEVIHEWRNAVIEELGGEVTVSARACTYYPICGYAQLEVGRGGSREGGGGHPVLANE